MTVIHAVKMLSHEVFALLIGDEGSNPTPGGFTIILVKRDDSLDERGLLRWDSFEGIAQKWTSLIDIREKKAE